MDIRAIGLGLAFVILWSSAFSSARIIVADAPAIAALSVRFLLAGVIGVGLAKVLGQGWHFTRAQWRGIVVFGLCQNTLYLGLYFYAMRSVEASLASVLASSMPLFVALLSVVFMKARLNLLAVIGLSLGFLGVILIMGSRLARGSDPVGLFLCVVGVLALAVATLTVQKTDAGDRILMVVGLQSLIGALPLIALSPLVDDYAMNMSTELVIAMIYTTLMPGLLATWIWFKLVARIGTVRASAYHFLNPFFGVAIAAVILSEAITMWDFFGVATVMLGIWAVQLSKA